MSAGKIWTRHSVLDGQTLHDTFPEKGSLKTRDTYGSGTTFLCLTVFGWKPFKADS